MQTGAFRRIKRHVFFFILVQVISALLKCLGNCPNTNYKILYTGNLRLEIYNFYPSY